MIATDRKAIAYTSKRSEFVLLKTSSTHRNFKKRQIYQYYNLILIFENDHVILVTYEILNRFYLQTPNGKLLVKYLRKYSRLTLNLFLVVAQQMAMWVLF